MSTSQERLREWLLENRGDETQENLASDIRAKVPGWTIDRTRYSKYETGAAPIGPKVRDHFIAYWTSRGRPGPDDPKPSGTHGGAGGTTPHPPDGPADLTRLFKLLEDQTAAITSLVGELREARQDRDQLRDLLAATTAMATENRRQLLEYQARSGNPYAPQHGADEGHAAPHQTGE